MARIVMKDSAGSEDGVREPAVIRQPDGSLLFEGMLPIDELKDLLEVQVLPGDALGDYNTLGGFIMTQLGRVPVTGDKYQWAGFEFQIIRMDGHRVDRVTVMPKPDNDEPLEL